MQVNNATRAKVIIRTRLELRKAELLPVNCMMSGVGVESTLENVLSVLWTTERYSSVVVGSFWSVDVQAESIVIVTYSVTLVV